MLRKLSGKCRYALQSGKTQQQPSKLSRPADYQLRVCLSDSGVPTPTLEVDDDLHLCKAPAFARPAPTPEAAQLTAASIYSSTRQTYIEVS